VKVDVTYGLPTTIEPPPDTLCLASYCVLLFGAYVIVGYHNVSPLWFSLYDMMTC